MVRVILSEPKRRRRIRVLFAAHTLRIVRRRSESVSKSDRSHEMSCLSAAKDPRPVIGAQATDPSASLRLAQDDMDWRMADLLTGSQDDTSGQGETSVQA